MTQTGLAMGVAVLLAGGAAFAADVPPAGDKAGELTHLREEQQCGQIGEVFWRLAEQRKGGADEKTATRRVAEWSAGLAQTGSHYTKNNSAAIGDAAHLVFKLPQLNSVSLGAFGKQSCLLQFAFEHDENRKTAGIVQLAGAAMSCQKQNPGEVSNGALGECIRLAELEIAEKLKTARVEIK